MSTLYSLLRPAARGRERVLCLHSSGGSPRHWDPYAELLAPQHNVLAPELIGYAGEASWPKGAPASLDAEAQRLAALLHAAPAHVVGHSYGGAVALQLALRWPERVASLTLYEPVRFALLLGADDAVSVALGESIVGIGRRIGLQVLSGNLHTAAQRFIDYWSGDGAWEALAPRQRDAVAARMTKVQAEFEALFADRVPAAAYARLAMPVRLIAGMRSPRPTRRVTELLAASIAHAEHVVLPGLAHMAPVTDPARVAEHLPPWLCPPRVPLAAAA